VVILVIVYNAERRVPETFAEFFENLFSIFLVRHDGTKPGFSRSRKTKLANSEFRRLFEAFCFVAHKQNLPTAMSHAEAEAAISVAAETVGVTVNSDAFISDVRNVTCLLIEEGLKLHFIHKAIQDFFSAQFIRSCAESDVRAFYGDLAKGTDWVEWVAELAFLRRIDAHNFYNFFYFQGLSSQPYFADDYVLTDNDVASIVAQIEIELKPNQLEIRITAQPNTSMAERDFLVSFVIRRILSDISKERTVHALSDAVHNGATATSGIVSDLQTNELIHKSIREALRQFRMQMNEARKIEDTRKKRSALLKIGSRNS
jgi:hypothetical protein